jgi:hypothetical protein
MWPLRDKRWKLKASNNVVINLLVGSFSPNHAQRINRGLKHSVIGRDLVVIHSVSL